MFTLCTQWLAAMHILLTVLKHIIKLKSRRLTVFAANNSAAKELSQKIIALIGKVCSVSECGNLYQFRI